MQLFSKLEYMELILKSSFMLLIYTKSYVYLQNILFIH